MADGDDVVGAEEDVGLAIQDAVALGLGRAGDDEEFGAVDLQLGDLMRRQGVLDRQGVQVETAHQDVELFIRRLVQADPEVLPPGQAQPLRRQRRFAHPLAVLVDVGGDDAHGRSFFAMPRSEGSALSTRRSP